MPGPSATTAQALDAVFVLTNATTSPFIWVFVVGFAAHSEGFFMATATNYTSTSAFYRNDTLVATCATAANSTFLPFSTSVISPSRGAVASRLRVSCPRNCNGSSALWGSQTYAVDSSICAAALHAGAISFNATGTSDVVAVMSSVTGFTGSTRNGVTSQTRSGAAAGFFLARGDAVSQALPSSANMFSGFGQPSLARAAPLAGLDTSADTLFVEGTTFAGQSAYVCFTTSANTSLYVTLAYTDKPAAAGAATQLVNNLDLRLRVGQSSWLFGNGVASGDRQNNVERVTSSAADGTRTCAVVYTQALPVGARAASDPHPVTHFMRRTHASTRAVPISTGPWPSVAARAPSPLHPCSSRSVPKATCALAELPPPAGCSKFFITATGAPSAHAASAHSTCKWPAGSWASLRATRDVCAY
jgi:hypothetical protein